jgi:putative oxidoreductase
MDALKAFAPLAHWLPRFALAAIFGYHSYPKLVDSVATGEAMELAGPVVLGLGVVEILCAALILYGGTGAEWATQIAGLVFAALMGFAILTVHANYGWNSVGNLGMEFQVLIAAVSLYFAFRGNDA